MWFIIETWLRSQKSECTKAIVHYSYTLHHAIRQNRAKEKGGGVGILVKSALQIEHIKIKPFQSFEHFALKIKGNASGAIFVCIYRLDYEKTNIFFPEFMELLEILSATSKFVIAGDINIHCDKPTDSITKRFNNLLTAFDLVQVVDKPTHKAGHTLDVLVLQKDIEVNSMEVNDICLSDHFLVSFELSITARIATHYKTITFRNLKLTDTVQFRNSLDNCLNTLGHRNNLNDTVNEYNETLNGLMNSFAPIVSKQIKVVPKCPWFDHEYKGLRKKRRQLEKKYKQTRSEIDKIAFIDARKKTTNLAKQKKGTYYVTKIDNAINKQKCLFSVIAELTGKQKTNVLPKSESDFLLANDFLNFFKQKITDMRKKFKSPETFCRIEPSAVLFDKLNVFRPASLDEITKIVGMFGISTSPADPLCSKVIKSNLDRLLPVWLELVNLSLHDGSMSCLKSAVIIPLLKSLDAITDSNIFKNYRPVSNLVFLSKLIERCVASRLDEHLAANNLEDCHQFGYKKGHSTELLLTKVLDKILLAFDNKLASSLLLLDLSAAFDTVDQDKLLSILFNEIGITGTAFEWFESFLKGRSQQVQIGDTCSDLEYLEFGVAQGSVLGPRLFNIYMRSMYPRLQCIAFEVDGFADDPQLYKHFNVAFQFEVLIYSVNECMRVVSDWIHEFYLCLNCAKNLGVRLDQHPNFKVQITKVVLSCYQSLRSIGRIKCFLPKETLQTVMTSLIFSKIDYCNALYYGINSVEIRKLQSVQNTAARIIYGHRKFDRARVSPMLQELHWLKVLMTELSSISV